jgi:hypothetical protein
LEDLRRRVSNARNVPRRHTASRPVSDQASFKTTLSGSCRDRSDSKCSGKDPRHRRPSFGAIDRDKWTGTRVANNPIVEMLAGSLPQIIGTSGGETPIGTMHSDAIHGHSVSDDVFGGAGHDLLWCGNQDDTVCGGSGTDDVHGRAGNDVLRGSTGADILTGGVGTIRV